MRLNWRICKSFNMGVPFRILTVLFPIPCLLIMAFICVLLRKNRGKKSYGRILRRSFLASFAAFVILLVITCVRLDAVSFIRSQTVGSTFIEDNYVDPDKTSITFLAK